MVVTASQVFDFLERHETGSVDRHELALPAFGVLRRSLRQIVLKFRESDDEDALDISDNLRRLLSEWLTMPVTFDSGMAGAVRDLLGGIEFVRIRWGADVATLYETAIRAAEGLQSIENPLREKLRAVIRELRCSTCTLRIFCHRGARSCFESLFVPPNDPPLSQDIFLHSVKDYRETRPFDVLVKVGPLRSRGWGSAPDAILTAPRFCTLIQVVWSGCSDEPDFGYDPVTPAEGAAGGDGTGMVAAPAAGHSPMKWNMRVIRSGEDPGAAPQYSSEADELRVFREMNQTREKRSAVLIEITGEQGILYPPHSQILSFDVDAADGQAIDRRIPGQTLVEGMFVIMPQVGDVDLGGIRAEQGRHSGIWKERLAREYQTDVAGLISRLQAAGLRLMHIQAAVRHWRRPASTVIHAPQQLKHFKILLDVIGLGGDETDEARSRTGPFWHRAWNEIRRSRGEAIHAGFEEHEIIEEQLLAILSSVMSQIREKALTSEEFIQEIPASHGIAGRFLFFKVLGIEEGFSVPGTELKAALPMNVIDQWRD